VLGKIPVVRDRLMIEAERAASKSTKIFRRDVGTGSNEQDFVEHFFTMEIT
jgi:hypothetical protein